MTTPHQVELFIVTAKDRRPQNEHITHACSTPQGYVSFAKKSGRPIMNKEVQDLYVFRLKIPLDVQIVKPDQLKNTLPHAEAIGLHAFDHPERVKLIRHGKFRFQNTPVDTPVCENTTISIYPEATRIS